MTYMLIVLLRSTAMIMSLRIVLLSTFFYGYIVCAALLAGENPAIKIENFTTIYYHKYTGKGYLDSNLPRRLDFGVKQSGGEVYEAVGLNITYTKDFNFVRTHQLLGPENAARNFYVGYPPLRSDDIIPAYGRLYFVTVKCPLPGDETHSVEFNWIGEHQRNLGVSLADDTFQVILSSPGHVCYTNVRSHMVRLTKVDPVAGRPKEWVAAFKNDDGYRPLDNPIFVKNGDVMMLGDKGHRAIAVVPRDEKTGVIGWVEFDPEPLSEDAIKAKGWGDRIVRPAK